MRAEGRLYSQRLYSQTLQLRCSLLLLAPPPSTGGALPQLCLWRQRCIDSSEEQLDREVPEDHADGRLGRALERVLAHVEQGDMAAFEPRAQLGDALAGVGASAVLVDAAERAA